MKRMKECDTFWVVTYMKGNDWGLKPYKEEQICHTEEELQYCLNRLDYYTYDCLDYYTYDIEIKKVTEYEFNE